MYLTFYLTVPYTRQTPRNNNIMVTFTIRSLSTVVIKFTSFLIVYYII